MNYFKTHFILFGLIFLISTIIIAQEAQFKTMCEEQKCTISGYNAQNIHIGYLKLNGCHITFLSIFPAFQKKGFGKALLKLAQEQASNHECKEVSLYSLKALLNYYQQNGFSCDQSRNCTHPV